MLSDNRWCPVIEEALYEARHGVLFVHCKLLYPSYKSRDMFVTQVACLSLPVYIPVMPNIIVINSGMTMDVYEYLHEFEHLVVNQIVSFFNQKI